ncbi:MAG: HD domain-containing protein [Muricoprocola sp.]
MEEKKKICAEMYDFIEQYARENNLKYTTESLPLVRDLMSEVAEVQCMDINGVTRYRGFYQHGLEVSKLLIGLVLPIDKEEEDIVLAAALCHVIVNKISYEEMYKELFEKRQMDLRIEEIISLITNDMDLSLAGQTEYYHRIQENKLAMIVFLTDRANLMSQVYTMSFWSANEYIFETRTHLFPMCVYAKERYPELIPVINILMEKARTVVDACAILINRFEKREMELTEDILSYQEENSRIRGIIKTLKQNKTK